MAKTALIIGGSGGIGEAVSRRLAGAGWRLLLHGRQDTVLQQRCQSLASLGVEAQWKTAELSRLDEVEALADWAMANGPLDAVIWCAGGGRSVDAGPSARTEWERTLTTILRSPMILTAHTLPALQSRQGAYLFVCGIYAKMGVARMAAHCAARHGLEGFAKALFEEVRESGVRVCLIHPGFVNTPLTQSDRLDPSRMIQPDDVATLMITALSLPASACVTELTVRPQRSPYR